MYTTHLPNSAYVLANLMRIYLISSLSYRKQLKSARAISLEICKKRRLEASLLPNLVQLDYKLSNTIDTTDKTDTKDESGI